MKMVQAGSVFLRVPQPWRKIVALIADPTSPFLILSFVLSSRIFGTYRLKARVPCHAYPFEKHLSEMLRLPKIGTCKTSDCSSQF
jgi:hypothetical protein